MAEFNPDKHAIVAVVTDTQDVDHGQHFHLSLPNLVQEVRQLEAAAPDLSGIESRLAELESKSKVPAVVSRETTDEPDKNQVKFIIKRLNALEARQTELAARVDALEARPHVSEETLKQLDDGLNAKIQHLVEKHVNGALGDLRSRVVTIERNTTSTVAGEPQSAQLEKLGESVQSFGKYVKTVETEFDQRIAYVEQICAEVAENITDTNLKTMKLSTRLYRALQALEHDADAA